MARFRDKTTVVSTLKRLLEGSQAPYSAMIEISDHCNEACVHCYQVHGQKSEMTTDEVKGVIDELAEMGVLMLTISGGEATLRHDFLDIVEHARKRRFAVKIYTNGLRITAEVARKLADLAVQEVHISLYSHRAEVHDGVTRVPGSFEKTVSAVRHLVEASIAVVLKTPLMQANAAEYREYIALADSLGADFSLGPTIHAREDGTLGPQKLAMDQRTRVLAESDPATGLGSGRPKTQQADVNTRPCGACTGVVHIEANGEMRPCALLTVPVGNTLTEGVREAWASNPEARLIRSLSWADIHGCRDCDLRPFCTRCFANAQAEGGDALGPYPSACKRALARFEANRGYPPVVVVGARLDTRRGPYAGTATAVIATKADRITDADRALAAAHKWIRPEQRGPLVQLRRPGKPHARAQDTPSGPGRE